MRKFLLVIVILAIAGAGAWLWSGGDMTRLRAALSGDTSAPTETTTQDAAPGPDAGGEPLSGAVTEPSSASDPASVAADAAADAAAIAADAAADANAAAPQSDAARQAQEAAEQAIDAADRAAEAAAPPAPAETPETIATLLTAEGYDPVRVAALIDAALIAEEQKVSLKALLNSASSNPTMLDAALNQVRTVIR